MKRVRSCVAAVALMAPAVAVGVTAMPGGASAGTFSITPWGRPGGLAGGTSGTTVGFGGGPAINAASVAVGAGQDGTFPGPPALMYGSGHLTILPKLDFGALGHQTDYATGINSSGAIAGIGQFAPALSGGVTFQALEWKSGGVTDLSPGVDALALSINDTGTVVGYQDFNGGTSSASSEAVQFNGGRASTGLGFLPSPSSPPQSAAFGISQSGQIVGDALNSSAQELPVSFAGGVATPLPLPAGTAGGGASAVSPVNGHIVGAAAINGFIEEAAQFGPGGSSLLGLLPGDVYSAAAAVNSAGVSVGWAGTNPLIFADDTRTAVMYLGGKVVNLNNYLPANSGWQLMEATGINDSDVIAGVGLFQGHVEGFTMTLPTIFGIIVQPLIVLPPLINLPIASLPVIGPSLNAALNSLLGL